MGRVMIASSEADAAAAEAIEQHHAQLAGTLRSLVQALVAACDPGGDRDRAAPARSRLVDWCERELLPHAAAEEKALYPAARGIREGSLLVDGMVREHQLLTDLVRELRSLGEPAHAAATSTALRVLFESHLDKENELILPMLTTAPDVSLADLLHGMHELVGQGPGHLDSAHASAGDASAGHASAGRSEAEAATAAGGPIAGCGCGEQDRNGYPELDARRIPHAIRHATIFGALDTVRPGGGLVLIAPHDPIPLLRQAEKRFPGRFDVHYLERGPQDWRLAFVRHESA